MTVNEKAVQELLEDIKDNEVNGQKMNEKQWSKFAESVRTANPGIPPAQLGDELFEVKRRYYSN